MMSPAKSADENTLTDHSDESLAALCAKGIDAAERELLRRQMQAIYWLPKRAFGADEEVLGDFLVFAIEKIRERDILGKYDPTRGARFSTWFGVVLRRLYLDYLRANPPTPAEVPLAEEVTPAPAGEDEEEPSLLDAMERRCQVLFKLLLCDTYALTPEDLQWIADAAGMSVLDVARAVATLEETLRSRETRLQKRYDQLAKAHFWKTSYEKELQSVTSGLSHPWTREHSEVNAVSRKLERRSDEYRRLIHELSGTAGIVTAPYKDLAALLQVKEGTLASQISRCRAGAAQLLARKREDEA